MSLQSTRRRFMALGAVVGMEPFRRATAQTVVTQTVGSWDVIYYGGVLSIADPIDSAVVTASAKTGDGPTALIGRAQLELQYDGTFLGSSIKITDNQFVAGGLSLTVQILADGKEIDSFPNAAQSKPLTAYFGNDLSGLVPVKNLKVALVSGNTQLVILEVNLASTAAALAAMKPGVDAAIYKASLANANKPKTGCFLTTACVEMIGLDDQCFELTMLRRFRDSVMAKTPAGRRAIDAYCRLAPLILTEIRKAGDERRLVRLYFTHILPSVIAARIGLNRLAARIYAAMMRRLISEYLPGAPAVPRTHPLIERSARAKLCK